MRLESKTKLEFEKGKTKPTAESSDVYVFDSDKERDLFVELKDYLLKNYKGKRALKRLVNNIAWFIDEGRGDFFAGFVFDAQGTLSCWGVYTGGQDPDKYTEYTKFMQTYCKDLMEKKDKKDNLVCFALVEVFNVLVGQMKDLGLVSVS